MKMTHSIAAAALKKEKNIENRRKNIETCTLDETLTLTKGDHLLLDKKGMDLNLMHRRLHVQ
jgi:hypothetical protein